MKPYLYEHAYLCNLLCEKLNINSTQALDLLGKVKDQLKIWNEEGLTHNEVIYKIKLMYNSNK